MTTTMTIWWRQNDVTAWRHQTLKWRFMTDLWRWRRRPSSFWRLNDDDDDARHHWKKNDGVMTISTLPLMTPPLDTVSGIPKPDIGIPKTFEYQTRWRHSNTGQICLVFELVIIWIPNKFFWYLNVLQMLCILTSFQVLAPPESWSNHHPGTLNLFQLKMNKKGWKQL